MSSTHDLEKLDPTITRSQTPAPVHLDEIRDSTFSCYEESVQDKDSTVTLPRAFAGTSRIINPPETRQPHQHHDPTRRRAWLTVFGGFLALFCTFGQMNAFGTFQTYYARHQLEASSPSTISWIGSLQLWVFFFSVCVVRAGHLRDFC